MCFIKLMLVFMYSLTLVLSDSDTTKIANLSNKNDTTNGNNLKLLEINNGTANESHDNLTLAKDEGRKKKEKDLMSKILPMLAIPFLISTSLIPMMLVSLKVMLIKSFFVGKMAILLLALNALWKINNQGAVYSHNINLNHEQKELVSEHYGYNNGEEYGAYVNRRKRR